MKLLIYCSGSLGREVYDLAETINNMDKRYSSIEFIDDIRVEKQFYGTNVYKFDEIISKFNILSYRCIIANGEPEVRKIIYKKLEKANIKLETLIHPTAIISNTATIGIGTLICSNVFVSSNSNIGDNVLLQPNSIVTHDININKHTVVSSLAAIAGHCKIGDSVFIGMGATIREKIIIEDNAIVGMGSVVCKNVERDSVVLGNPAYKIRDNIDKKIFK